MSTKVRYKSQFERLDNASQSGSIAVVTTTVIREISKIEEVPVAILFTPAHNSQMPEWAPEVIREIKAVLGESSDNTLEIRLNRAVARANTFVFNRVLSDLDAQGTQFSLLLGAMTSKDLCVVRAGNGQAAFFANPQSGQQTGLLLSGSHNSAYLGRRASISPEVIRPRQADVGDKVYLLANGQSAGQQGTIALPTNKSYKAGPQEKNDVNSIVLQKSSSFVPSLGSPSLSWILVPLLGLLLLGGILFGARWLGSINTTPSTPVLPTASTVGITETVVGIQTATTEVVEVPSVTNTATVIVPAVIVDIPTALPIVIQLPIAVETTGVETPVVAALVPPTPLPVPTTPIPPTNTSAPFPTNTVAPATLTFTPPSPDTPAPPTATLTPTIIIPSAQPVLVAPADNLTVELGQRVTFKWSWDGELPEGYGFEIVCLNNGSQRGLHRAQDTTTSREISGSFEQQVVLKDQFNQNQCPTIFDWCVVAVQVDPYSYETQGKCEQTFTLRLRGGSSAPENTPEVKEFVEE